MADIARFHRPPGAWRKAGPEAPRAIMTPSATINPLETSRLARLR
ncbi:MAG TPA: hypothetical protein VL356_11835 [Acidocella sp.]|nr:hypothetical protein [Acidocella sp.]